MLVNYSKQNYQKKVCQLSHITNTLINNKYSSKELIVFIDNVDNGYLRRIKCERFY